MTVHYFHYLSYVNELSFVLDKEKEMVMECEGPLIYVFVFIHVLVFM